MLMDGSSGLQSIGVSQQPISIPGSKEKEGVEIVYVHTVTVDSDGSSTIIR
jgi:hypothetical protein